MSQLGAAIFMHQCSEAAPHSSGQAHCQQLQAPIGARNSQYSCSWHLSLFFNFTSCVTVAVTTRTWNVMADVCTTTMADVCTTTTADVCTSFTCWRH